MTQFFKCKVCGNLVAMLNNSGAPMSCCDQPMSELIANTVDAAREKHIPFVEITGSSLNAQVGEVIHPMLPEHHIQWIYLETKQGGQFKRLNPGDAPAALFKTDGETPVAVYEFCNLHGLWKKELDN